MAQFQRRKMLMSLIALATLVASAMFAFATTHGQFSRAQQFSGVSTKEFSVPSGSDPWGTAFDSSGHVWVAVPGCDPTPMCSSNTPPGKIAEFDPNTSSWIATYTLPAGYAQPLFLAFDQHGKLWFPLPMGNSIGMFDPSTQTFQQWAVPTAGSGPWGIAIDSQGNIWFTEHYANQIGRFTPSTQTFLEIATPASNSQPYGITIDAASNVWFTENNSAVALIGEYTAQGRLLEYKIRNVQANGLTPHLITVDPNGNIWWSEGFAGKLGELQVALAQPGTNNGVTEYAYSISCGSCGKHTSGIAIDGLGNIWFDDSLQSIFGSFPNTGTGSFSLYNTPTSNSHPHDGLQVDAQNRIWFDEEFINKLALAIQSAPPTPTPSPTPSPTLAMDTFQRPNQTLWGTASDSQKWGGDANILKAFSIVANTGHLSSTSNKAYNAVLGPTATNAQALFSGSLSNFNSTNLGSVLHWIDGNNWYRASINGTRLVLQRRINGTSTILKSVAFTATAGTSYTLRFQVVGTTLSAKVWATGQTEPTNWMATASDSTLPSGFCGLRIQLANGVAATITSFQATGM